MIKIKEILKDRIIFTNDWQIFHYHLQKWDEVNYAAFEKSIKNSILENMVFDSIEIEPARHGFLLNGHLINCYSEQEGRSPDILKIYLVDEDTNLIKMLYVMAEIIDYK